MNRESSSSWIDPGGQVYPLNGKGHAEFAYEILLNEKIGEHMGKKIPTDGSMEQKGKSGEVAKADAQRELGDPADPQHAAELCERGWVQASKSPGHLTVRAAGLSQIGNSLHQILAISSVDDSVVFAFRHAGSGVSVGLIGKSLGGPVDSVMAQLTELADGKLSMRDTDIWPSQNHGIRFFE